MLAARARCEVLSRLTPACQWCLLVQLGVGALILGCTDGWSRHVARDGALVDHF